MGPILSKIAVLLLMVAILVYTVINFAAGKTNMMLVVIAVFIFITSGSRIITELINDIKNR